ncbi:unnamed protein product [Arctogadus glacialis]
MHKLFLGTLFPQEASSAPSPGPRETQGDDRGLRGCGRERREDVSVFSRIVRGGGETEVAERLETHLLTEPAEQRREPPNARHCTTFVPPAYRAFSHRGPGVKAPGAPTDAPPSPTRTDPHITTTPNTNPPPSHHPHPHHLHPDPHPDLSTPTIPETTIPDTTPTIPDTTPTIPDTTPTIPDTTPTSDTSTFDNCRRAATTSDSTLLLKGRLHLAGSLPAPNWPDEIMKDDLDMTFKTVSMTLLLLMSVTSLCLSSNGSATRQVFGELRVTNTTRLFSESSCSTINKPSPTKRPYIAPSLRNVAFTRL